MTKDLTKWLAFTLAEVLITLTVIGIVAAMTIPTLMKNYQERVEREQVRMVKYKLTQATSVMNTEGLIGPYYNSGTDPNATTENFVNTLQKYLKITKVCDNTNLKACWPTSAINRPNPNNPDTFEAKSVSELINGEAISALGLGTKNTRTVGIVTNDGTSMILTYSPQCTPLDPYRNYNYSFTDKKPVTNATTNCISAIFDINGSKGPNKIGKDVRTLNSLFGYAKFGNTAISKAECEKLIPKGLVKECSYEADTWAGAVKKCNDIGLHLPDLQTLANIAGAYYGRTDIGPYTILGTTTGTYTKASDFQKGNDSRTDFIQAPGVTIPAGANTSVSSLSGYFWSSSEVTSTTAYRRTICSNGSSWAENGRNSTDYVPLCVGD